MGNCTQRAISDERNSVTVLTDSRKVVNVGAPYVEGDMKGEYYGRSCRSLPVYGENTLGYLLRQGTSPRRVKPKIQVSPQRRNGVWKAKVVIGTKQLEEILAVEGNTHALIDQLRVAAAAATSTSSSGMVKDRGLSSRHRLAREKDERYFC